MQKGLNIYVYVLIMTGVTALLLSFLYNILDPIQAKNKEDAKKKSILNALPDGGVGLDFDKNVKFVLLDANGNIKFEQKPDTKNEEIEKLFSELNKRGEGVKYSKLVDVDLSLEEKFSPEKRVYPVYVVDAKEGKTTIISVRGNGLWDKIWGYVSLDNKSGKWAVTGVNFEHKAETPGLGAEIKDSKAFKDQFKGKQIYDNNGKFVSVTVSKAPKNKDWEVKSISGATVTSVGVSEMMVRGMSYYLPYLEKNTAKSNGNK